MRQTTTQPGTTHPEITHPGTTRPGTDQTAATQSAHTATTDPAHESPMSQTAASPRAEQPAAGPRTEPKAPTENATEAGPSVEPAPQSGHNPPARATSEARGTSEARATSGVRAEAHTGTEPGPTPETPPEETAGSPATSDFPHSPGSIGSAEATGVAEAVGASGTTDEAGEGSERRPRSLHVGWFTRRLVNPLVLWLSRRGLSLYGAQELLVRGRQSGEWRRTPVNPMRVGGANYLVAPRGHVQWTHNLRAAGEGRLRLGRRSRRFTAVEVPDEEKPELLRCYLRRWKAEVSGYFHQAGVGANSTDEEWRQAASGFPVFRLTYPDDHHG